MKIYLPGRREAVGDVHLQVEMGQVGGIGEAVKVNGPCSLKWLLITVNDCCLTDRRFLLDP